MQTHFVRFDFGIIQHIIDDHQKRFTRGFDGLHIKLLFFIQIRIGHQIRHAYNAVHWRTDFMAHIGQKRGFGTIGTFSVFLCSFQGFLVVHRLSDIQNQAHHIAAMPPPVNQLDIFFVPKLDDN